MSTAFVDRVRRAARHDAFAFQEMLDRFLPRIRRLLALRLGRTHLAGDLERVRHALLERVAEDPPTWTNEAELFHATMASCLPHLEPADATYPGAPRVEPTGNTGGSLSQDPVVEWRIPFARAIGRDRARRRIEHALLALPAAQREALVLRHYLGFSFDRLARELGLADELAARVEHAVALQALAHGARDTRDVEP